MYHGMRAYNKSLSPGVCFYSSSTVLQQQLAVAFGTEYNKRLLVKTFGSPQLSVTAGSK